MVFSGSVYIQGRVTLGGGSPYLLGRVTLLGGLILGSNETHFSPSRQARVKMRSPKGPKYIYGQENKLYFYYYRYGGH